MAQKPQYDSTPEVTRIPHINQDNFQKGQNYFAAAEIESELLPTISIGAQYKTRRTMRAKVANLVRQRIFPITTICFVALASGIGFAHNLTAGEAARLTADGQFNAVERAAHHRVWQRDDFVTLPNGEVINRPHRVVEHATGLHYFRDGEWKESRAEIEVVADGARADKGGHTVHFNANLNSLGAISVTASDGKLLRSHVVGLAYTDTATWESVIIAQIKDSQGVVLPPNQVLYPDAFSGADCDVLYIYTRSGFSQDVILRAKPSASPETYGFNSATTVLEVWTEFVEAPEPVKQVRTADGIQDEWLTFGSMHFTRGHAFALGAPHNRISGAPLGKTWLKSGNRTFLIEAVRYDAVKRELDQLPAGRAELPANRGSRMALLNNVIAPPTAAKQPVQMALNNHAFDPGQGLVLDYVSYEGADFYQPVTFKGDTTYLISDVANFVGDVIFEGGTILKYSENAILETFNGTVFNTDEYRPAIFTSRNDNSVGENLYAAGTATNYYQALNITASGLEYKHIRILYADYGLDTYSMKLRNAEFVHCGIAIWTHTGTAEVDNVLMVDVGTAFYGYEYTTAARHVTVDGCTTLAADYYNPADSHIAFTNSLLVNIGSTGAVSFTTNFTEMTTNSIFQTVGGGSHYLASSSPYRNVGTTNISTNVLASIRRRTTYPPILLTNRITSDAMLGPQAQRDTDVPDLGYHPPPLDYLVSGLIITNATLLLTNGVAVGIDYSLDSWGFILKAGRIISQGNAVNPNHIVRAHMAQELSSGNPPSRAVFYDGLASSRDSEVRMRFTEYDQAAEDGYLYYAGQNFSAVEWLHSSAYNVSLVLDMSGSGSLACGITNTLWERGGLEFDGTSALLDLRNNLFRNLTFHITSGSTNWATARDNLFDSSYVDDHGNTISNSHNAYYQTNGPGLGGATSRTNLTSLTYEPGPLGAYYQPTTSPLIGLGSRNADAAGLYHFTTTTNQVKETNSVVDIGLHYVAVNSSGQAKDGDGDGVPDYLEDVDGDGNVDSGETNPNDPTDWGLRVIITRPRSGSVLP